MDTDAGLLFVLTGMSEKSATQVAGVASARFVNAIVG